MKKSFIFVILLSLICTQASGRDLVADLEKGTLGSLWVGQPYTSDEAIDEAIGAKVGYINEPFPEDMDDEVLYWDHLYGMQGISLIVTETSSSTEITDISLTVAEPDPPYNKYTKVFAGTIMPNIPRGADKDDIVNIFGEPDKSHRYTGGSGFSYAKPYGTLLFLFEGKKGLTSISMSKEEVL